jgi:hypothetical protein
MKVLEGRHRYRACIEAGVEPRFNEYTGGDALAYVISLNMKRRHLDESQRAMVAAKIAKLPRGANQHSPIGEPSQADAAKMLNVGKRSVERARTVIEKGTPEIIKAVDSGKVSVSAAAARLAPPKAIRDAAPNTIDSPKEKARHDNPKFPDYLLAFITNGNDEPRFPIGEKWDGAEVARRRAMRNAKEVFIHNLANHVPLDKDGDREHVRLTLLSQQN